MSRSKKKTIFLSRRDGLLLQSGFCTVIANQLAEDNETAPKGKARIGNAVIYLQGGQKENNAQLTDKQMANGAEQAEACPIFPAAKTAQADINREQDEYQKNRRQKGRIGSFYKVEVIGEQINQNDVGNPIEETGENGFFRKVHFISPILCCLRRERRYAASRKGIRGSRNRNTFFIQKPP